MSSKHHLNVEAFAEPLSPEARYWVGFLLADGCISSNKGYPQISLGLKFSDAEHVRKFARFVGVLEESVIEFDTMNNFGRNHGVRLSFTGKELIPQLAKYGIVPRKTKIASVPLSLAHDPDFWRGLVDGDGSLRCTPTAYLQLDGARNIVDSFSSYLGFITGLIPAIIPHSSIFRAGLNGKRAKVALQTIYYSGCSPSLDRKTAIAEQAKLWRDKRSRR